MLKPGFLLVMTASALSPSDASAWLELPTDKELTAMCNEQGGAGFRFGQTELPDTALSENPIQLDRAFGMFSSLEIWTTTNSKEVMVLRYEVSSEGYQADAVEAAMAPRLQNLGWKPVSEDYERPLYSVAPIPLWMKPVTIDGTNTEVLLQIEGGIESTSLYCGRADLMPKSWADVIAEALATHSE